MSKKYVQLFEELQDEKGRISLSRFEFEILADRYHVEKLEEPREKTYVEKFGFWLLFGTVFSIGFWAGSGLT